MNSLFDEIKHFSSIWNWQSFELNCVHSTRQSHYSCCLDLSTHIRSGMISNLRSTAHYSQMKDFNVTFATLLNAHVQLLNVSVRFAQVAPTRSLMAKLTAGVWCLNWPINVLDQLEQMFKQSFSSCCSQVSSWFHDVKLTMNQQTVPCHCDASSWTFSDGSGHRAGCNRDIKTQEESQKGAEVDVLWPHPVLMTTILWTLLWKNRWWMLLNCRHD